MKNNYLFVGIVLLIAVAIFIFRGGKTLVREEKTVQNQQLGYKITFHRSWNSESMGVPEAITPHFALSRKNSKNDAMTLVEIKRLDPGATSLREAYQKEYGDRDNALTKNAGVAPPSILETTFYGAPALKITPGDGTLEEIRIFQHKNNWIEASASVQGNNKDAGDWPDAIRILDSLTLF